VLKITARVDAFVSDNAVSDGRRRTPRFRWKKYSEI